MIACHKKVQKYRKKQKSTNKFQFSLNIRIFGNWYYSVFNVIEYITEEGIEKTSTIDQEEICTWPYSTAPCPRGVWTWLQGSRSHAGSSAHCCQDRTFVCFIIKVLLISHRYIYVYICGRILDHWITFTFDQVLYFII